MQVSVNRSIVRSARAYGASEPPKSDMSPPESPSGSSGARLSLRMVSPDTATRGAVEKIAPDRKGLVTVKEEQSSWNAGNCLRASRSRAVYRRTLSDAASASEMAPGAPVGSRAGAVRLPCQWSNHLKKWASLLRLQLRSSERRTMARWSCSAFVPCTCPATPAGRHEVDAHRCRRQRLQLWP